ncbi:MAG: transporter substrate-binding domain-containing protein, partial [Tahibacter sp.]
MISFAPPICAVDATSKPGGDWLARHSQVRLAVQDDFSPVDSADGKGLQHGLAADYLRMIADRTGLKFRLVTTHGLDDSIDALRQGRVDMIASAFVSADHSELALFSAPYLRLPCAAFVRNADTSLHLEQLDSHSIGLIAGHVCGDRVVEFAPRASISKYSQASAAIAALASGKVDAVVGDMVTIQAVASGNAPRMAGQIGGDGALAFAVRKDWPQLIQVLDAALAKISVDEETT